MRLYRRVFIAVMAHTLAGVLLVASYMALVLTDLASLASTLLLVLIFIVVTVWLVLWLLLRAKCPHCGAPALYTVLGGAHFSFKLFWIEECPRCGREV